MKVWTTKDFSGWCPEATAAVVVAENEVQARILLDKVFTAFPWEQDTEEPYTIQELPLTAPSVVILADGGW